MPDEKTITAATLPTFDACAAACREGRATALERFIWGHQPGGTSSEEWRRGLAAVMREARPMSDSRNTKCTAYPLNGCAHPQFCKDGCAGRPIQTGDDRMPYREMMAYASVPHGGDDDAG